MKSKIHTEQLIAAAISRRPRPASYIPTIRFLNSGVVSCTPLVLPISTDLKRLGDLNRTRRVTYAKEHEPRDEGTIQRRFRIPFKTRVRAPGHPRASRTRTIRARGIFSTRGSRQEPQPGSIQRRTSPLPDRRHCRPASSESRSR